MKEKFQCEANKYLEWNVLILCGVCRKSSTGKNFFSFNLQLNNKLQYFDKDYDHENKACSF